MAVKANTFWDTRRSKTSPGLWRLSLSLSLWTDVRWQERGEELWWWSAAFVDAGGAGKLCIVLGWKEPRVRVGMWLFGAGACSLWRSGWGDSDFDNELCLWTVLVYFLGFRDTWNHGLNESRRTNCGDIHSTWVEEELLIYCYVIIDSAWYLVANQS